jgi:hypothetical protein
MCYVGKMSKSLQIRCDDGLLNGLRAAARNDGLLVSEAARRAIRAYVDRPPPSVASEAIWVAITALAANALSYYAIEQMGRRPASDGFALVIKVLESERNQDA